MAYLAQYDYKLTARKSVFTRAVKHSDATPVASTSGGGLGDPRLDPAGTGSLHACCCVAMRRPSRRRQQGIKSSAHSSDERTVATISSAHPIVSDKPPSGVTGPSQRGPSKANP